MEGNSVWVLDKQIKYIDILFVENINLIWSWNKIILFTLDFFLQFVEKPTWQREKPIEKI